MTFRTQINVLHISKLLFILYSLTKWNDTFSLSIFIRSIKLSTSTFYKYTHFQTNLSRLPIYTNKAYQHPTLEKKPQGLKLICFSAVFLGMASVSVRVYSYFFARRVAWRMQARSYSLLQLETRCSPVGLIAPRYSSWGRRLPKAVRLHEWQWISFFCFFISTRPFLPRYTASATTALVHFVFQRRDGDWVFWLALDGTFRCTLFFRKSTRDGFLQRDGMAFIWVISFFRTASCNNNNKICLQAAN